MGFSAFMGILGTAVSGIVGGTAGQVLGGIIGLGGSPFVGGLVSDAADAVTGAFTDAAASGAADTAITGAMTDADVLVADASGGALVGGQLLNADQIAQLGIPYAGYTDAASQILSQNDWLPTTELVSSTGAGAFGGGYDINNIFSPLKDLQQGITPNIVTDATGGALVNGQYLNQSQLISQGLISPGQAFKGNLMGLDTLSSAVSDTAGTATDAASSGANFGFGGVTDLGNSAGAPLITDASGNLVSDVGTGALPGTTSGGGLSAGGLGSALTNGVGKAIGGIAQGALGLSQAGKVNGQQAAAAADPFASQRPYYQGLLNNLFKNPSSLANLPGYQAGLEATQRAQASQGYTGSGNAQSAIADFGTNDFYQMASLLSVLSGATTGSPQTAGQVLSQGGVNQAQLTGQAANSLIYGLSGLLGGGSSSNNQTNNASNGTQANFISNLFGSSGQSAMNSSSSGVDTSLYDYSQ